MKLTPPQLKALVRWELSELGYKALKENGHG